MWSKDLGFRTCTGYPRLGRMERTGWEEGDDLCILEQVGGRTRDVRGTRETCVTGETGFPREGGE